MNQAVPEKKPKPKHCTCPHFLKLDIILLNTQEANVYQSHQKNLMNSFFPFLSLNSVDGSFNFQTFQMLLSDLNEQNKNYE